MTKKTRRRAPRALPVRTMARKNGGLALVVDNFTQSVTIPAEASTPPDGYWPLMLPDGCPRRALLLGLGGGTLAALLARRCPGVAMVGIEHSADVLAMARRDFGLDALVGLKVVEADAFAWVEEHATSEPGSYDLICLDLFDGGRLTPGTLARPFLRQIATLLRREGTLTVNLMRTARLPEQLHRVESIFTIERRLRLWGNVVLHLCIPTSPPAPMATPARPSPATH